jgi:hypothetical protein
MFQPFETSLLRQEARSTAAAAIAKLLILSTSQAWISMM